MRREKKRVHWSELGQHPGRVLVGGGGGREGKEEEEALGSGSGSIVLLSGQRRGRGQRRGDRGFLFVLFFLFESCNKNTIRFGK